MRIELPNKDKDGFTLVEVMVSAIVAAVFYASLFELNGMCLRLLESTKQSMAALQGVHDRAEVLRNRAFSDLTRTDCGACVPVAPNTTCVTTPCVRDLMATAANPAPIAERFTEVVKISNHPATANGVTQFTRSPNGSVVTNSLRTDPVTDLVRVEVSVSWTTTTGGRTRTERTVCMVANGTKK